MSKLLFFSLHNNDGVICILDHREGEISILGKRRGQNSLLKFMINNIQD
jgi:hypothetical protein